MSDQDIKDNNLIVIAAVEEYAKKHDMQTADVLLLFNQHNILYLTEKVEMGAMILS